MSFKNTILALPVLLLLLAAGCGSNSFEFLADKDSDAAKREAAQLAIDRGDYAAAIAILEASCPNNVCSNLEDAKKLASAYMGLAGLDLLDFLDSADSFSTGGGAGSDFSAISTILPDLTLSNLTAMNNAIAVLENVPAADRTDDINLQLGMSQVVGSVIAIGVAGGGYDSSGQPVSCGGDCDSTEAAAIMNTSTTDSSGATTTVGEYTASNITSGVANINQTSLGDSDTTNQVNDLVNNIQNSTDASCSNSNNTGTPASTTVTSTQVGNYVTACL